MTGRPPHLPSTRPPASAHAHQRLGSPSLPTPRLSTPLPPSTRSPSTPSDGTCRSALESTTHGRRRPSLCPGAVLFSTTAAYHIQFKIPEIHCSRTHPVGFYEQTTIQVKDVLGVLTKSAY
ncbi:hypothetical protein C8R46DRAFT_1215353 [Mycena filopes]|nr:hypothetical protein C8R46DRAFT_1215348 [Mycena filopes]KAJ7173407.1 hypothetical protein C8R46DRAFT_1215353 [Mycena filopes]